MEATLRQAMKLLATVDEKDGPRDRVQNLLASGLFVDLLEVDTLPNRDEFRKLLKLPPLTLPTMTIQVPLRKLEPPYEKWELVENAGSPVGTLDLCLAEFLEKGESSVKGEVMRERAKRTHPVVLGEIHARALLEAQDHIPEALRRFYLVFPGTVWRVSDGRLFVPDLFWFGERWVLDWRWLGGDWRGLDRVVRLCE